MRYEDDFGSFWMVDDAEFIKRRHLSRGRPRKYEPGPFGGGTQFAEEGRDKPSEENTRAVFEKKDKASCSE